MHKLGVFSLTALVAISVFLSLGVPIQAQTSVQDIVEIQNEGLAGWYTDTAFSAPNNLVMAFYDLSLGVVRVIECTNADCTTRTESQLNTGSGDTGRSVALVYDDANSANIAYRDHAAGNLLIANCDPDCNSATIGLVAGLGSDLDPGPGTDIRGDAGWHVDLVFDGITDTFILAYRNDADAIRDNWTLDYATCQFSMGWSCSTPVTIGTAGGSGGFPAIALADDGTPVIAWRDGTANVLRFFRCADQTCASGTSILNINGAPDHNYGYFTRADYDGTNIVFANYAVRSAATVANDFISVVTCNADTSVNPVCSTPISTQNRNVQAEGFFNDVKLDSSGTPVISYLDLINGEAEILRCGLPTCAPDVSDAITEMPLPTGLAGLPGYWTSLQLDASDNALMTFTTHDAGDDVFLYNENLPAELPPFMVVTPADGDVRAFPGGSVNVNFSEPTEFTGTAFNLSCTDGTDIDFFASSFPLTTTGAEIIPDTASDNEDCTFSVTASEITDGDSDDGTYNNPLRNMLVRFTTDDGLDATFDSVTPIGSGGNVRLELNFSKPVNLPIGGATLTCNAGPALAFTGLPATGQRTVTIIPVEPLPAGGNCTVDVTDFRNMDFGSSVGSNNDLDGLNDLLGLAAAPRIDAVATTNPGPLDRPNLSGSQGFSIPATPPICFAFNQTSGMLFGSSDHSAVSDAVVAATAGDTIKIAGICTANSTETIQNLINLNKDLTLIGGYPVSGTLNMANPGYWLQTPDPVANPTVIDANSSNRAATTVPERIFIVRNGVTASISGLTITGGNAAGSGSPLWVGGGIYLEASSALTIHNSSITDNTAQFSGGGIYNDNGTLTIRNSSISGNTASNSGGGIYNQFGNLTLSNSTLTDNSAPNGGGFFNRGTLTLINSLLSGNSADDDGGGIYNFSAGTLTLSNSTLSGNSAGSDGGGVYNTNILTLSNSIVYGNTATTAGNELFLSSNATIDYSLFDGSAAGVGGAGSILGNVGNITSPPPLINVFTDPNNGDYTLAQPFSPAINAGDNALYNALPSPPATELLDNPRIVAGTVDMGAYEAQQLCFVEGQTPVGTITNANNPLQAALAGSADPIRVAGYCLADAMYTGAEMASITRNVTIEGGWNTSFNARDITGTPTTLDANSANRSTDGRIITQTTGTATIDGLTFINGSTTNGGAINIENATATVRNSTFRNNVATGDGGALRQASGGSLTVQNSSFEGNIAQTFSGGGIWAASLVVEESTFLNNQAGDFGGGLVTVNSLNVRNSLFADNTSTEGGGISVFAGAGIIRNVTVANNTAPTGAGISVNDRGTLLKDVDIFNSIVWGNNTGTQIFRGPSNATIDINNTIVEGGFTGDNSVVALTSDPLFVDAANGDYRLQASSPALEAGDNGNAQGVNDLQGIDRVIFTVDVGAYEYPRCFVSYLDGTPQIVSASSITNAVNILQTAVNDVDDGLVRVAGYCLADETFTGADMVVIAGNMTVQGGWDATFTTRNPVQTPTTLDANRANRATKGRVIFNGATTTLDSLIIQNGETTAGGGGISNNGTLTVVDSSVRNSAGGFFGGGIVSSGIPNSLTVVNSVIRGNESDVYGAGIGGDTSTLTIVNSEISGNRTGFGGAGVYNFANEPTATPTTTLVNSTIAGNSAGTIGGGLFLPASGTVNLDNTIIYGNDAPSGPDIHITRNDATEVVTANNSLYTSAGGAGSVVNNAGNIIDPGVPTTAVFADPQDPLYTPTVVGDYTLALNSPAIDAGDDSLINESTQGIDLTGDGDTNDILPLDLQRIPREIDDITVTDTGSDTGGAVNGAIVDMGAYELALCAISARNIFDFGIDVYFSAITNATNVIQDVHDSNLTTIKLAGYCVAVGDFTGSNILDTDRDVTITGGYPVVGGSVNWNATPDPVANPVIIDANRAGRSTTGRILSIGNSANVTLDGLTLQNGQQAQGGAILQQGGGDLTITDTTLTNNLAPMGRGGAINVLSGTLSISNSTLSHNETVLGGAIFTERPTIIRNSVIDQNTSVSRGGITSESDLTIIDSSITNNVAGTEGGGVHASVSGNLRVINSIINGNSATNNGGGVFFGAGGSFTLVNSTVAGNLADGDGGGLFILNPFTTINSTITGNRAVSEGGGIFTFGEISLRNSIVYNNNAPSGADVFSFNNINVRNTLYGSFGGIFSLTPDGVNIITLPAANADDVFVTPIDPASAPTTVGDLHLETGSVAAATGNNPDVQTEASLGIDFNNDSDTLDDIPDLDGNPRIVGTVDMGAYEVQPIIVDTNVDENDGDYSAGDYSLREAIANATNGNTIVFDSSLNGQQITLDNMLDTDGTLAINNSITIDASSLSNGIIIDGNADVPRLFEVGLALTVTLNNLTIQNGYSTSGSSGVGIFTDNGSTLTLIDVILQDHVEVASSFFGGVAIRNNGDLRLFNSIVRRNSGTATSSPPTSNGGVAGIRNVSSPGNFIMVNSAIVDNTSDGDNDIRVAGLYSVSPTTIINSTITGNVASGTQSNIAGGVFILGDIVSPIPFVVYNSIIYGNTADNYDAMQITPGVNLTIENSLIGSRSGPATLSASNIDDPTYPNGLDDLFTDPANGDYTLNGAQLNLLGDQTINPISKGANGWLNEATVGADLNGDTDQTDDLTTGTDLAGDPRLAGSNVDMGAYELPVADGGSSFVVTGFDAYPDHVLGGETSLTIVVQATDTVGTPDGASSDAASSVPTISIFYSADATCAADDTVLVEIGIPAENLRAGQALSLRQDILLPRDLLAAQANNADLASLPAGTLSQDVGYLCAAVANDLDAGAAIDATNGKLIVADDITYFPYDGNGDGLVTPTDAMAVIQALGRADAQYDSDGNGIVTPSEALNVLLRLGYARNHSVIEPENALNLGNNHETRDGAAAQTASALPVAPRGAGLAAVLLTITELDDVPGINAGEAFNLNIYTADANAVPLFAGYIDLAYDPALLRADALRYGAGYDLLQLGTIANENGSISDLGATNSAFSASGDGLLAIVRMTALRGGAPEVHATASDLPLAQSVAYGDASDLRSGLQTAGISLSIRTPQNAQTLPVTAGRGGTQGGALPIAPVNPQPTPTPLPALPVQGRE